jgi:hypothetical protein
VLLFISCLIKLHHSWSERTDPSFSGMTYRITYMVRLHVNW